MADAGGIIVLARKIFPAVVALACWERRGEMHSGLLSRQPGVIFTAGNVSDLPSRCPVQFHSGQRRQARLLGRDLRQNVAALEVEDPPGAGAALSLAPRPAPGQRVVAVGIAGEGELAVVEALVVEEPRPRRGLIVTDATALPGGGPLLDSEGQVVGLVTAAGAAVPIGRALALLERLSHPRLGARVRALPPSLARSLGVARGTGVVVLSVEPGSAAEQVGLNSDGDRDVIVAVAGAPVASAQELAQALESRHGEALELTVLRHGQELTVQVRL